MTNNLDNVQSKINRTHDIASFNKDCKSDRTGIEPGTSYEVFRNNTTAVEVIVKEVPQRRMRDPIHHEIIIRRLHEEIMNLKQESDKANSRLISTRQGFKRLVYEMKKQIETANQKELEKYTKNLALELENEKLKTLLESKCNLIAKLKKEFVSMKRVLKFVLKGVSCAPQLTEYYTFNSDPEYDDFEKGLKRETRVKFTNMFEGAGAGATFDSTMSKDLNSFEKY